MKLPSAPALLYMSLAALLFSVMTALAKYAGQFMPSSQVVFFRSLFTAAVLLAWHTACCRGKSLLGRQRRWLLLRGIFGALALLLFFYSLTGLAAADALLINQTSPVFVLLLAAPLLGEPIRRGQLLLVPVLLLGVALVLRPTFRVAGWHGLAALGSALLAACAYLCIRKITRRELAHVVVLYFAAAALVASTPLMAPGFVWPTPRLWLVLAGVGLVSVAAQLLMTVAYRHDRAGRVAMAGTLGPVFAGLWDALFWQRLPGVSTICGAVLVIGSLFVLEHMRRRGR